MSRKRPRKNLPKLIRSIRSTDFEIRARRTNFKYFRFFRAGPLSRPTGIRKLSLSRSVTDRRHPFETPCMADYSVIGEIFKNSPIYNLLNTVLFIIDSHSRTISAYKIY